MWYYICGGGATAVSVDTTAEPGPFLCHVYVIRMFVSDLRGASFLSDIPCIMFDRAGDFFVVSSSANAVSPSAHGPDSASPDHQRAGQEHCDFHGMVAAYVCQTSSLTLGHDVVRLAQQGFRAMVPRHL